MIPAQREASPPGDQRVVVTGIGVLTPIGCDVEALWAVLRAGEPAVRRLTRFDPGDFRARCAAEIADELYDPRTVVSARQARRLDRFALLSLAVSLQAIADAQLTTCSRVLADAGCYLGTALGGLAFAEAQHAAFLHSGARGVNPNLALAVFGGAGPTNVAIELGLHGPSLANSNFRASGAVAIGEAFRLIRDGYVSVMLAGGVEAPLAPLTFGAFAMIKAMSTADIDPRQTSRPFDAARDGFVMGEGAAMLVIESLEHAQRRHAPIYAELRGYGMTNDAHHMVAPEPSGIQAARAIQIALADAGIEAADVGYVNAHASATPLGDRAETRAIERVFGPGTQVAVSATKGLYGHPLGASGAIETAITALTLARGFIPGTANFVAADADNALNVIGPHGQVARPRIAVNNAFGFGGINAALVLSALPSDPEE